MNNNEEVIITQALEALHQKLDFTGKYAPAKARDKHDGILAFRRKGAKLNFIVECKREVRQTHVPQLLHQHRQAGDQPFLVIAERIFPIPKADLRREGVSYLEANGNACIDADGQFILIEGAPLVKRGGDKTNRAFTKAGLKVVFLLLTHPEAAGAGYRDIALWADSSLGNVTNVMNGLKETGHLLAVNRKEWKLTAKAQLVQKWMDAYEQRLKPTLEIGSFRFLKAEDFAGWKNLELATKRTLWGGEPAADLLTGYLRPATLMLYTDETRAELMKHYRLVPDAKGPVKAYKKFWKHYPEKGATVPPLLVYADLLATGDGRSAETAQKIYEQILKPVLE